MSAPEQKIFRLFISQMPRQMRKLIIFVDSGNIEGMFARALLFLLVVISWLNVYARDPVCEYMKGLIPDRKVAKRWHKAEKLLKKHECIKAISQIKQIRGRILNTMKGSYNKCQDEKMARRLTFYTYKYPPILMPGLMGLAPADKILLEVAHCLCHKGNIKKGIDFIKDMLSLRKTPATLSAYSLLLFKIGNGKAALDVLKNGCADNMLCKKTLLFLDKDVKMTHKSENKMDKEKDEAIPGK